MMDPMLEIADQSAKLQGAEDALLRAAGWPEALIKAACDPFTYVLGLRDGSIIYFHAATPSGNANEWVKLDCAVFERHVDPNLFHCATGNYFQRGVDVRVSDIVFVADQGH